MFEITFTHGRKLTDGWPYRDGKARFLHTWVSRFSGKRIVAVGWFRFIIRKGKEAHND